MRRGSCRWQGWNKREIGGFMDSGFQTELSVRLKKDSDRIWIVTAGLQYYSELLNRLITVPTWFQTESNESIGESDKVEDERLFYTDFASVPRIPVVYNLWGDRAHREAVLHDYVYCKNSIPILTRSEADSVFLEAMKSTGKPIYIRYPMYLGVRIGGSACYHRRNVEDIL
jgi:hypothetical protein